MVSEQDDDYAGGWTFTDEDGEEIFVPDCEDPDEEEAA